MERQLDPRRDRSGGGELVHAQRMAADTGLLPGRQVQRPVGSATASPACRGQHRAGPGRRAARCRRSACRRHHRNPPRRGPGAGGRPAGLGRSCAGACSRRGAASRPAVGGSSTARPADPAGAAGPAATVGPPGPSPPAGPAPATARYRRTAPARHRPAAGRQGQFASPAAGDRLAGSPIRRGHRRGPGRFRGHPPARPPAGHLRTRAARPAVTTMPRAPTRATSKRGAPVGPRGPDRTGAGMVPGAATGLAACSTERVPLSQGSGPCQPQAAGRHHGAKPQAQPQQAEGPHLATMRDGRICHHPVIGATIGRSRAPDQWARCSNQTKMIGKPPAMAQPTGSRGPATDPAAQGRPDPQRGQRRRRNQPIRRATARQHRPGGERREPDRHRQGRRLPQGPAGKAPSAAATPTSASTNHGPGGPNSHSPAASSAIAAAAGTGPRKASSTAAPSAASASSTMPTRRRSAWVAARPPTTRPAPNTRERRQHDPASRAVPPQRQHQPDQQPGQRQQPAAVRAIAGANRWAGRASAPSRTPGRRPPRALPVRAARPAGAARPRAAPPRGRRRARQGRTKRRSCRPSCRSGEALASPGCIRSRVGRAQAAATPVGRRVSGQHDQVGFAFLQPHRHTAAHCQAIVVTVMAPLVLCMASPGR